MAEPNAIVSRIYIKIKGKAVPRSVMQNLLEAVVDQHAHLPDMFTLRLIDPGLELIEKGPFELTKTIQIEAAKADGTKVKLIDGEITALEPVFDEGMVAELVVRGYDVSHRLYRQKKSKAYLNIKDSDLAEEIGRSLKLKTAVDPTRIVYDHIYQHNQSDLGFLVQRAWRIGYECFVSGGTLNFCKPRPGPACVILTWGDDLLSFRPRMNLAEQVDEVVIKGWDVSQKSAITGRAQKGSLYPKIGEPKDGAGWAQGFSPGKVVIVDQPVISQVEADLLAAARLDEISGVFVEAEGEAFRRPDIQAGRMIELKALGKRFSGKYLVTRAIHNYSPDGLKTIFSVRGTRTGLFAEQLTHEQPLDRWPGVVTALVTNTDDPKDWGRIKVKFPWMAEDAESDWARVTGPGAGPEAGIFVMPEVGDEVLVVFAHGDFSQPFILGGLWNGQHKIPPEDSKAAKGEKPLVRTWRSRKGHSFAMYDDATRKIDIHTAGGHTITLDDQKQEVVITSKGNMKVTVNQDITIEGKANLKINAAGNISMETNSNMSLKATQLNLEATAKATLKAANISIDGSALTEVKGGLVKLN